jgi:endogenous inhibitor of DNA gyrase (YacG/DUF329 family)
MRVRAIRRCPECGKAGLRMESPDGTRLSEANDEEMELYCPRCVKIVAPFVETRGASKRRPVLGLGRRQR